MLSGIEIFKFFVSDHLNKNKEVVGRNKDVEQFDHSLSG